MKKLYCIITETLTKEDITNDLLHTEFNFFYGDATPVAPHVITENEYIYKVSQIVVGNEAHNYLDNIIKGYYEDINYSITYPN